jgi:hypothetical protein
MMKAHFLNGPTRWRRWLVLLLLAALPVGAGVLGWARRRGPEADDLIYPMDADPRLSFSTPYENTRPGVGYVGDEACAGCHPSQAETFRQHPMGRSLAPVLGASPVERYGEGTHNPFQAHGLRYRVAQRGGRVVHTEGRYDKQGRAEFEAEAEVHYALGSGTRGRAYLIDRDGFLFQSPVSWYSGKGLWDLSPGYETVEYHFERKIQAHCLFCHSNRVEPVEETLNRFALPVFRGYAIGCERCHGPGALHVARRQAREPLEGTDTSIVHPGRLPAPLREAVCEQCHLQGEVTLERRGRHFFDYRPGLPLHQFMAVFMRPGELTGKKAVSHVPEMVASRCFQASGGRMGCTSCHDPHALPAAQTKVAYYRDRCLACHQERGCSLAAEVRRQRSPGDDCARCHMPARGELDIAHAAQTDHRILRRPEADTPPAVAAGPDEAPLVPFHPELADVRDGDAQRDLGVGLVSVAVRLPPGDDQRALVKRALPLLETGLRHAPDDVPALHAKGFVLRTDGLKAEALSVFEEALAHSPGSEVALVNAAGLAAELGLDQAALGYWERALAVNPWASVVHRIMARYLVDHRRWQQAEPHCDAALKLNPADVEARKLRVLCHFALGRPEQARAEFRTLVRTEPAAAEELRRWFARQAGR